MKVTEHIKQANGKTLFSFEIVPPQKGQNIQDLYNNIDPLMEFNPPFVDVTYHREEYVYKKMPNGLLKRKTTKKRPGTVGICAAISNKYNVDTVPHIICGGFSSEFDISVKSAINIKSCLPNSYQSYLIYLKNHTKLSD